MIKLLKKANFFLKLFGINLKVFFQSILNLQWYVRDYIRFKKLNNTDFEISGFYPCLLDKSDTAGSSNGHYFHQDLYVSSKIFESNPVKHVDIGSRIDGFVSSVAAYRNIEVFDIRKQPSSPHSNLLFRELDFTSVPESYYNYTDSLSTLHTFEHIGLGRYGDKIDPNAHLIFLNNLYNFLQPNGILYFSTPIGHQRIIYNAHRIFSINYLKKIFEGKFIINKFSYVDDEGDFFESIDLSDHFIVKSNSFKYSLGIFELQKI
jgi:hypothetical protein